MIIFIGNIIDDNEYAWYKDNSLAPIPISSNTHQKSIIKGLRYYEDTKVIYLSPCGYFPKRFKKAFVSEHEIDSNTKRLKSCNIPLIRFVYNIKSQKEEILKIVNNNDIIICYMPSYQKILAILKIKRLYPSIIIIVIVPDLIQHSYSKSSPSIFRLLFKIKRYIDAKIINKLLKNIDGFVFLTKYMKNKIGNGQSYIVQEAIYDIDMNNEYIPINVHESKFVFTYCGKLSVFNGVDRLINAFIKIKDNNARLFLCGDGELMIYAKEKSCYDNRIKVFGQISHQRAIQIEQESTVLINPRYTSFDNNRYSFPSKIIEYLALGRPVISSHLNGIPADYDSHLFYIENDSEEKLLQTMEKILNFSKEELNIIGINNAKFVYNEKSSVAQGKRIIDFIKNIKFNKNEYNRE